MTVLLWIGVLVGSSILSLASVAMSIQVADKFGQHDHPDGSRKLQIQPIPKLGGIALALSFSVASFLLLWLLGFSNTSVRAAMVLIPALLAAVVGYVDDARNIQPIPRLLLQSSIGGLAWIMGTRIGITGIFWLDALLTIAWFMVLINGINLLDNSDGLAATTVLVSSLGATAIAAMFGQTLFTLLGLALAGTCLGYLWHNWYPARVYMGDSGAYFLGVMLASLIIGLQPQTFPPPVAVAIALLLAALPIVDTTFVVVRRLRHGIHPFTAGRDHLAHLLQDRGTTVVNSVITLQVGLLLAVSLAVGLAAVQYR